MFATFYKLLSARLREKVPELRQIALYNGQYLNPEEELPVFPPACFIEFGEIPWQDTGLHTQQAEAEIYFHLAADFILPTDGFDMEHFNAQEFDVRVLDLLQKMHLALHGFQIKNAEGFHSSEFTRSRTRPEPLPGGLSVWVVAYRCNLIDNTANRDRHQDEYIIPSLYVKK